MSSDVVYLHRDNLKHGSIVSVEPIDYYGNYKGKPNSELYKAHFSNITVNKRNIKKFIDLQIGDVVPSNYALLQFSEQSVYSSAFNEDSIITANYIYDYYSFLINKLVKEEVTITDACANVGGNTIQFASIFDKVNAIEFLPLEYNRLRNNVQVYKFNNVKVFTGDGINNIITNKVEQDIIFFDPPWGGSECKKYKNIGLSLSDKDITEDIDYIIENDLAKLVVLKGPDNTYLKSKKYYKSAVRFIKRNMTYQQSQLTTAQEVKLFDLYFFHRSSQREVDEYIKCLSEYIEDSDINDNKVEVEYINSFTEDNYPLRNVVIYKITTDNYNNPVSVIYNLEDLNHYEAIIGVNYKLDDESVQSIQADFKYKNSDINNMINYSVSQSTQIVSKELTRMEVYDDIINDVLDFFNNNRINIGKEEVRKMINNYIFNKISVRTTIDDPVIISQVSKDANSKIFMDLEYIENNIRSRIDKRVKYNIVKHIQDLFYKFSELLVSDNNISDGFIEKKEFESLSSNFIYKYSIPDYLTDEYTEKEITIPIYDFMREKIGEKLDNNKYEYVACYLRYNYMDLNTIALAFDYSDDITTKYFKKETTLECFASVFNFYYDNWCSAFPDIESKFGSLGSFWDLPINDIIKYENIVVNPPFDTNIIDKTLERIDNIIVDSRVIQRRLNIVIILPNWDDMYNIKRYMRNYKYKIIKKKDTKFIDWFAGGKIIQPSDIIVFMI